MSFGRVLIFLNIFGRSECAGHMKVTLSTNEKDDTAVAGTHGANLMSYGCYVYYVF